MQRCLAQANTSTLALRSALLCAMPRALQEPTKLGCVCSHDGRHRAEFEAEDSGRKVRFKGPWRDSEDVAQDDLLTIRTAGSAMKTRTEALQLMEFQADHLKADAIREANGIREDGGIGMKQDQYRARVQFVDSNGVHREKYGPARHNERRAQADLEWMRKEAGGKPSRAEHHEAMSIEAQRLQQHAVYEAHVAMAVNKDKFDRQHMQTDSETESEQDPDVAIWDEPFTYVDVSTREARERLVNPPPRKKPRKDTPPADAAEATMRLARLSLSRSNPSEL